MAIGYKTTHAATGRPTIGRSDRAGAVKRVRVQGHRRVSGQGSATEIVALVFMVMLVSATIFPSNAVEVPSVAELPTCQNRPSLEPPLMMLTSEALAVVSVLPIRNTPY